MHEKDNYLKTAELSTEQNCNMIDGVPNNTPIPPTPPELDAKPLDKVKEPKGRSFWRPPSARSPRLKTKRACCRSCVSLPSS